MAKYKYYEREVHYYETDKMGIVHHSNYARYLEETRIDLMRFYGLEFEEIESRGYMIPVLELQSKFLESIRFGEKIKIVVNIDGMSAAKFYFSYVIYDENMEHIKHKASSSHCLIDNDFRPVAFKKLPEDLKERFMNMINDFQEEK